MTQASTSPLFEELLAMAARSAVARVNVSLPASIVDYDSSTQRATVRLVPRFRRRDPDADDAIVTYKAPDLPGIPVAFPGGGDFSVTWPLVAGDTGLLVVADRSIDEWLKEGGTESTPQDMRRHDLTDGIFIPGLRSFADPVPAAGVDGSAMVVRSATVLLGSSSASDFVALASLVKAELDALWSSLNAKAAHTHAGVTTGVGTSGTPAVWTTGSASDVAATKVKAE